MYQATIEIGCWMGVEEHKFKASSLEGIVDELQQVQELECLVRMGRRQGPKEDESALAYIESFLEKYYNNELEIRDFEEFDVEFSLGTIKCKSISKI